MEDKEQIKQLSDLALIVRATRRGLGFTRDDLAAATGLSPKFISHIEAGKPTAQIGKVLSLLTELGITLFAKSPLVLSEKLLDNAKARRGSRSDD